MTKEFASRQKKKKNEGKERMVEGGVAFLEELTIKNNRSLMSLKR